jgi:hypothetical protein
VAVVENKCSSSSRNSNLGYIFQICFLLMCPIIVKNNVLPATLETVDLILNSILGHNVVLRMGAVERSVATRCINAGRVAIRSNFDYYIKFRLMAKYFIEKYSPRNPSIVVNLVNNFDTLVGELFSYLFLRVSWLQTRYLSVSLQARKRLALLHQQQQQGRDLFHALRMLMTVLQEGI